MKNKIAVILAIAVFMAGITGCTVKADPSVSALPIKSASSQIEFKPALPHAIGLSGVANARDLGGYKTADGKTVKIGVLLRTAALYHATANDLKIITDKYHVTQIIDFRTSKGIQKNPDPQINGVIETHLPIHSSAEKNTDGENQSYINMVTDSNSISAFKQFFMVLLNHKEGAVLFHCAAGKDRTGVASILLLSALGVDKNTIIQDYLLSNEYYSALSQKERVKEKWAMTVFDTITSKYGSMDIFLNQELGLTPQNKAKLKLMYLE